MSKKPPLREPFDKQHAKRAKALLESAPEHFYHYFGSFPSQFSSKTSLFLTYQISGLLVKTLAADKKYPLLKKDNWTIPIKMQLSHKHKTFFQFFASFLKSRINFKYFLKNMTLIDFVFRKLSPPKTGSEKCLKSLVSDYPLTSNVVNLLKLLWNQHQCTFILLIDHCKVNWLGKSFCYWHAKSWDCLLTHWLPIKSIFFFRETI